jgi:glycosyltransferase domain-containing protein
MSAPLTIVLTLKGRVAFTHRWMRYMNDQRCPYPILIADGGDDAVLEGDLRSASTYPRLSCEYIRYPFDVDHAAYYRKLADVVARVTTPFVLLADNDDFFLLDRIEPLLRVLGEHSGCVSCGGQRVTLKLFSGGQPSGNATGDSYEARVDLRPKSVIQSDPIDRICFFLANVRRLYLWNSWYAIHRTPALASATSVVRSQSFRDPVAHELHVHLSLLAAGRVIEVEQPFFINQQGSSQFTSTLEARGSVAERFASLKAEEDVIRSLDLLSPPLSATDKARIREALAGWLVTQQGKSPAPDVRPIELPVLEPYILSA